MSLLDKYGSYSNAASKIASNDISSIGEILTGTNKLGILLALRDRSPEECFHIIGKIDLPLEANIIMANILIGFARTDPSIPKLKIALLYVFDTLSRQLDSRMASDRSYERQIIKSFKKEVYSIYSGDQEVAEAISSTELSLRTV
jgi:hypothetical protein